MATRPPPTPDRLTRERGRSAPIVAVQSPRHVQLFATLWVAALPGPSVHRTAQVRAPGWAAILFSRSLPRSSSGAASPAVAGRPFTAKPTREAPSGPVHPSYRRQETRHISLVRTGSHAHLLTNHRRKRQGSQWGLDDSRGSLPFTEEGRLQRPWAFSHRQEVGAACRRAVTHICLSLPVPSAWRRPQFPS